MKLIIKQFILSLWRDGWLADNVCESHEMSEFDGWFETQYQKRFGSYEKKQIES